MEDSSEEDWEIVDYEEIAAAERSSGSGGLRWVLNLGKKAVITGLVFSTAPVVVPPLMVISAIGFVVSIPFGVVLASYVGTEQLMSKLLPPPTPPIRVRFPQIGYNDEIVDEKLSANVGVVQSNNVDVGEDDELDFDGKDREAWVDEDFPVKEEEEEIIVDELSIEKDVGAAGLQEKSGGEISNVSLINSLQTDAKQETVISVESGVLSTEDVGKIDTSVEEDRGMEEMLEKSREEINNESREEAKTETGVMTNEGGGVVDGLVERRYTPDAARVHIVSIEGPEGGVSTNEDVGEVDISIEKDRVPLGLDGTPDAAVMLEKSWDEERSLSIEEPPITESEVLTNEDVGEVDNSLEKERTTVGLEVMLDAADVQGKSRDEASNVSINEPPIVLTTEDVGEVDASVEEEHTLVGLEKMPDAVVIEKSRDEENRVSIEEPLIFGTEVLTNEDAGEVGTSVEKEHIPVNLEETLDAAVVPEKSRGVASSVQIEEYPIAETEVLTSEDVAEVNNSVAKEHTPVILEEIPDAAIVLGKSRDKANSVRTEEPPTFESEVLTNEDLGEVDNSVEKKHTPVGLEDMPDASVVLEKNQDEAGRLSKEKPPSVEGNILANEDVGEVDNSLEKEHTPVGLEVRPGAAVVQGKSQDEASNALIEELPIVETKVLVNEDVGEVDTSLEKDHTPVGLAETRDAAFKLEKNRDEVSNVSIDEAPGDVLSKEDVGEEEHAHVGLLEISSVHVSIESRVDSSVEKEQKPVGLIDKDGAVSKETIPSANNKGMESRALSNGDEHSKLTDTLEDAATTDRGGLNSNEAAIGDYEEIWKKMDAIRGIVGVKAPRQSSYFEELKALYLFTGIEPPSSTTEFNEKLSFLMTVIGLK